MVSDSAKLAREVLTAKTEPEPPIPDGDFLSWGLTLINLATYGRTYGGVAKGHIYRVCGRSSSGKTFLCRMLLAEAVKNKAFDGYELIYDDIELGALMDTLKFFGIGLVKRLVAPGYGAQSRRPVYSKTPKELYERMQRRLEKNKKFIWIVDSVDALKADNPTKMGDGKAKVNNEGIRNLIDKLKESGSIVVLVSQAHADLKSIFGGDTTSGGRALEYYPTLEIWLNKVATLKKKYKGMTFPVGSLISARIKKNRISGNNATVYFPFSPKYGIDDIGANVDYLKRTGRWPQTKGIITAEELEFQGSRTDLIKRIEDEEFERELQVIVGNVWHEIDVAITDERKPRYQ